MTSNIKCRECDFGYVNYDKDTGELKCTRCNCSWTAKTKMPEIGRIYKRKSIYSRYESGSAIITAIYQSGDFSFICIGTDQDPSPFKLHEFWEFWEEVDE